MECTTKPGSSTIMSYIFSSSQNRNVVHLQTISNKTELPCLLCGSSATSAIPGILGLLGPWIGVFHGDRYKAAPCTLLIVNVRRYHSHCHRRTLTVTRRNGL